MEIFNLVTNDFVWKPRKAFTHPVTPRRYLSVGGGEASERGMARRGETTRSVVLLFGDLLFAGGERRGSFGCV